MATNSELTLLASGYGLLEAGRWHPQLGLVFSDMMGGGVHHLAEGSDTVEVLIPHRKAVGGLVAHADGGLVVSGRNVSRKVPGSDETDILLEAAADEQFFNDLTADGRGRVFAGSMGIRVGDQQPAGRLYQIELDGTVQVVVEDLLIANGMGADPTDSFLFSVDSARHLVWRYALPEHGLAGDREMFADTSEYPGLPDGLAMGADGSIWIAIAGGSVVVGWDAKGNRIAEIPVPAELVTSVSFGGPDLNTLYVMTGVDDEHPHPDGGMLFRMPAPTTGLPAPTARVRRS